MQSTNVFTNQFFCPKQWLQKSRLTKTVWCFRESPDFSSVFCLKEIWICLAGLLYLFEGNIRSICVWSLSVIGCELDILGRRLTFHRAVNPDQDEWQQTLILQLQKLWMLNSEYDKAPKMCWIILLCVTTDDSQI